MTPIDPAEPTEQTMQIDRFTSDEITPEMAEAYAEVEAQVRAKMAGGEAIGGFIKSYHDEAGVVHIEVAYAYDPRELAELSAEHDKFSATIADASFESHVCDGDECPLCDPTEEGDEVIAEVLESFDELLALIDTLPASREMSLAKTRLEEALHWFIAGEAA